MAFDIAPRSILTFPAFRSIMSDVDDLLIPTTNGLSISEDENSVYVKTAVPGIDPKDVEITFDKGVLWVKGEAKKIENDTKEKVYRQMENSFSYRVVVPGELDQAKEPEATYKNGIMNITFAKLPQSQPKKIAVKTA